MKYSLTIYSKSGSVYNMDGISEESREEIGEWFSSENPSKLLEIRTNENHIYNIRLDSVECIEFEEIGE
jgi:hypothetical protein